MEEPNPSEVPGHPAAPAVEFAEWLPALGGSRLLRVHGEAAGGAAPTLVLDTPSGEHRVEPRAQARFTRAHEWRASYLIPSEVAAEGWSATTLEWHDGMRLHLPEPTDPGAQVVDPTVLANLRARRHPDSPAANAGPAQPSPTFATRAPEAEASPGTAAASPPAATGAACSLGAARAPSSSGAAAASLPAAAGAESSPGATAAPAISTSRAPDGASARSWADPPGAFSGSVFEAEAVWTAKRAELERELTRAAEAIARAEHGERAAREAVLAALAAMRADLRAAHAARAADADTIATLKSELEAERIAHAVARRTASDLRTALAQARRHPPETLRSALEAERKARADAEDALRETRQVGSALMQRIAELSRAHELDREALERHSREQAKSAAEAARRPEQETGELVANLEAAAASLRASTPAAEVAEPGGIAPGAETPADDDVAAAGEVPPGPVAAADMPAGDDIAAAGEVPPGAVAAADMPAGDDIAAAGEVPPGPVAAAETPAGGDVATGGEPAGLVVAPRDILPAEPTTSDFAALADAFAGPPARPLRRVLVALAQRDPVAAGEVLAGLLPAQGPVFDQPVAYDLTIAGVGTFAVTVCDGVAAIERVSKPRSRGEALFELRSDPLTLAELLAGDEHRIGRFRGRARVSRRRRKARVLEALPDARISLADALRAGARLEPALVYAALPLAIDPEWTAGHAFTIAQEITDPDARTWYVAVRDAAGIEVTESAPEEPPDATVTMTRAAFERLLRNEPPDPTERPLVRGDRAAVAILKAWTDRARGARQPRV